MIGSVIVGIVRAAAVHLLPEVELFVIYGVMALAVLISEDGTKVVKCPKLFVWKSNLD
jgi:branched-chain amino acid transport system permease protein